MFNQNIQAQQVTAAVAAAGAVGSLYFAYRYYQRNKLPSTWTHVGKITNYYMYPIKSCSPIKVKKAQCTYLGLKDGWLRDRVLMVVDDKNNFITARVYSELLLVEPVVRNSVLSLHHADLETLHINLAEVVAIQKSHDATVWGSKVPVFDCGQEASDWFTKLLSRPGQTFRLALYASQDCRNCKDFAAIKFYKMRNTDYGALPDECSYNLINEASVNDLNTRLTNVQVDHRWFRPNFTIEGSAPYDEDKWDFVKIGENVFKVIKPCTRCIMTTISPETGVRTSETSTVLDTLKSYRLIKDPEERKVIGNSPSMGIMMALRSGPGGFISLNDDVYVSYKN